MGDSNFILVKVKLKHSQKIINARNKSLHQLMRLLDLYLTDDFEIVFVKKTKRLFKTKTRAIPTPYLKALMEQYYLGFETTSQIFTSVNELRLSLNTDKRLKALFDLI